MLELDVVVGDKAWNKCFPRAQSRLEKIFTLMLNETARVKRTHVMLAVMLGNDAMIRELNHDFRGKDKATNVLSFSPYEDKEIPKMLALRSKEPLMLGDVILAQETVAAEAKAQGKEFAAHATHLALHGGLHLLGFDHQRPKDAASMEKIEIAILTKLGISNPYETTGKRIKDSA